MNELVIEATIENLDSVMDFMHDTLDEANCSMKNMIQLELVVEELFVNIAHYAYPDGNGSAVFQIALDEDGTSATFTFKDSGIPYNPLEHEDPDLTLELEEREIGGLGIFLVKKNVDSIRYEYRDGQNILQFKKRLR